MPARILRPAAVQLVCPACRAVRKAQPVGVATIAKRRREVVQCLSADCGLTWLPERTSVPAPASQAA
jgi:hypothetical protein